MVVMVVAWRKFEKFYSNILRDYRSFCSILNSERNPDPECYNKDVKRFKAKVRRVYNKRCEENDIKWN